MKIVSLAYNTFLEIIRQPFFSLILICTALIIASSPAFTFFTLMDSVKLVQDMALANMLLAGLFLAIFSAGDSLVRELQHHTVLTLLSKPMGRSSFVLAKFMGVLASQALSFYLLTIVSLLTVKFGTKDTATTILETQCMVLLGAALFLAMVIAAAMNYLANAIFLSTAVVIALPLFTLALLGAALLDHNWQFIAFGSDINWDIASAGVLAFCACALLSAVAITLATRCNLTLTALGTILVFCMGLSVGFIAGRLVDAAWLSGAIAAVVPDFQMFWVADALNIGAAIPLSYVASSAGYALSCIVACLALACWLFSRAEVS